MKSSEKIKNLCFSLYLVAVQNLIKNIYLFNWYEKVRQLSYSKHEKF